MVSNSNQMNGATGTRGSVYEYGTISTGTSRSICINNEGENKNMTANQSENENLLAKTRNGGNNFLSCVSNINRNTVSVALASFVLLLMGLIHISNTGISIMSTASNSPLSSSSSSSSSAAMLSLDHDHYPSSFLLDETYDETPLFYDDQQVDHLHLDDGRTYRQRYFKLSRNFQGPGHPILVIMGGEGPLGVPMLYPFVHEGLASTFGAFVLSPEHRFYGESQPVADGDPDVQDMMDYLSPDQALEDAVQLIQYVRNELGCDPDRTNANYCPVITFGGSYPGFLSAMLRFRYPDLVDASYASSAPLELYSQQVDSDAYFDKVTETAELASEGCADAVRSTLFAVQDHLVADYGDDDNDDDDDDDDNNKDDDDNNSHTKDNIIRAAAATGFCPKTFPKYVSSIEEFVSETVQYLVPAIFADFNMAYYPPGPDTALVKACAIFQQDDQTANPMQRLNQFFELRGKVEYGTTDNSDNDNNEESPSCFDLSLELPDGPNSKIRGSDNSGTGGGHAGEIWEFQCCKDLIVRAGYSERSMFLPRHFSYEWHENHCKARFPGIIVEPYRMNQQWGFDQLTKDKTSHIVFTNGMNDGWSTSSITNTTEMADQSKYHDIVVIDFPNGAHHSDLKAGVYPNPNDTADILEGYKQATKILSAWLDEIYSLQQ